MRSVTPESVRCCPRNGKRERIKTTVPWHGKVILKASKLNVDTPREPGDRPDTDSMTHPRWAGAVEAF
ncbi:hypothetical protein PSCICE_17110 [Pseudomonas cichorii]|nr:hypothetical protein PSCICE_17110 [Pseudomonas cichorii]